MIPSLEGARMKMRRREYTTLYLILISLYWLQAGDPRDKIYGVLGIIDGAAELNIRPNYGISIRDLYSNVTRNIMLKEKSLGLLAMAGVGWPTETLGLLPSWTPDFTNYGANNWDTRTWDASGKSNF
jgi:hypothetical protein